MNAVNAVNAVSSVNFAWSPVWQVAQASAPEGGLAANPLFQFLPILAVFAIFYFLLIAPMRKRQRALAHMVENLKKGDRVITNGGIYGEIAAIEDGVVHLKIADGVKVRMTKTAIAGLEGSAAATEVKSS